MKTQAANVSECYAPGNIPGIESHWKDGKQSMYRSQLITLKKYFPIDTDDSYEYK